MLKKLTYQWTEPEYVVTLVATSTVTVRRLSTMGAAKLSAIKKKGLPSEVVNKKMTRSFPVSREFFLGATVAKKFGNRWCTGKVDKSYQDEDEALWHITYSDFDVEDMTRQELAGCLVYHVSSGSATRL